ncbi:hypothetical protein BDP27DRAFT_488457 [Rhodocollybia butyracea]|uniref:Uncharacterized protein n=1 Tax=Rhodocollybia butyracea TaxID=206335 RepID=A0A9P5Q9E2_9AGAR|nr:hypothetical protein BDP27DRAFT_488457 [Rhodocollybia butyracea]
MIKTSAHCILSHSRGLLQFLRIVLLLRKDYALSVDFYCLLLDVSWIELESILSYLRWIIGKDEEIFGNLLYHLRSTSFAGEIFPWPSVCRDLARRTICIGKDIAAGKLSGDMDRCVASTVALQIHNYPHDTIILGVFLPKLHGLSLSDCLRIATNFFVIFETSIRCPKSNVTQMIFIPF